MGEAFHQKGPPTRNSPGEREYYVAPRRHRRHSRHRLLFPVLLGLLLFGGGFLLGKASAAPESPAPGGSSAAPAPLPSEPANTPASHQASDVSSGRTDTPDTGAAWNLILVNGAHPLSEEFLVPQMTELRSGHAIDSRAYPALQEMLDDARSEGLQPLVCSSFRTWDKQEALFSAKVQTYLDQGYSPEEADKNAAFWVARPGTSEHQTGLAVDIVDMDYQLLDEQQETTPVQQWLMAHCTEYGFILRYPPEKSDLTGIGYEPWHYRYVGKEAAMAIMEQGLCLEEYVQEQAAFA